MIVFFFLKTFKTTFGGITLKSLYRTSFFAPSPYAERPSAEQEKPKE